MGYLPPKSESAVSLSRFAILASPIKTVPQSNVHAIIGTETSFIFDI